MSYLKLIPTVLKYVLRRYYIIKKKIYTNHLKISEYTKNYIDLVHVSRCRCRSLQKYSRAEEEDEDENATANLVREPKSPKPAY